MRSTRANKPDGYLLDSYRIATAPELNSSRLTSFKSIRPPSQAFRTAPLCAGVLSLGSLSAW